uniref:Uncharacterized protein n=1 Tax=viral metagenome TaxID=1070528 RepID=A0A6H1ZHY0_9ZZZZ
MKKELIFICKKCRHNLYVDSNKVKKLFKIDCPHCGEEPDELWILSSEGNFEKDLNNS